MLRPYAPLMQTTLKKQSHNAATTLQTPQNSNVRHHDQAALINNFVQASHTEGSEEAQIPTTSEVARLKKPRPLSTSNKKLTRPATTTASAGHLMIGNSFNHIYGTKIANPKPPTIVTSTASERHNKRPPAGPSTLVTKAPSTVSLQTPLTGKSSSKAAGASRQTNLGARTLPGGSKLLQSKSTGKVGVSAANTGARAQARVGSESTSQNVTPQHTVKSSVGPSTHQLVHSNQEQSLHSKTTAPVAHMKKPQSCTSKSNYFSCFGCCAGASGKSVTHQKNVPTPQSRACSKRSQIVTQPVAKKTKGTLQPSLGTQGTLASGTIASGNLPTNHRVRTTDQSTDRLATSKKVASHQESLLKPVLASQTPRQALMLKRVSSPNAIYTSRAANVAGVGETRQSMTARGSRKQKKRSERNGSIQAGSSTKMHQTINSAALNFSAVAQDAMNSIETLKNNNQSSSLQHPYTRRYVTNSTPPRLSEEQPTSSLQKPQLKVQCRRDLQLQQSSEEPFEISPLRSSSNKKMTDITSPQAAPTPQGMNPHYYRPVIKPNFPVVAAPPMVRQHHLRHAGVTTAEQGARPFELNNSAPSQLVVPGCSLIDAQEGAGHHNEYQAFNRSMVESQDDTTVEHVVETNDRLSQARLSSMSHEGFKAGRQDSGVTIQTDLSAHQRSYNRGEVRKIDEQVRSVEIGKLPTKPRPDQKKKVYKTPEMCSSKLKVAMINLESDVLSSQELLQTLQRTEQRVTEKNSFNQTVSCLADTQNLQPHDSLHSRDSGPLLSQTNTAGGLTATTAFDQRNCTVTSKVIDLCISSQQTSLQNNSTAYMAAGSFKTQSLQHETVLSQTTVQHGRQRSLFSGPRAKDKSSFLSKASTMGRLPQQTLQSSSHASSVLIASLAPSTATLYAPHHAVSQTAGSQISDGSLTLRDNNVAASVSVRTTNGAQQQMLKQSLESGGSDSAKTAQVKKRRHSHSKSVSNLKKSSTTDKTRTAQDPPRSVLTSGTVMAHSTTSPLILKSKTGYLPTGNPRHQRQASSRNTASNNKSATTVNCKTTVANHPIQGSSSQADGTASDLANYMSPPVLASHKTVEYKAQQSQSSGLGSGQKSIGDSWAVQDPPRPETDKIRSQVEGRSYESQGLNAYEVAQEEEVVLEPDLPVPYSIVSLNSGSIKSPVIGGTTSKGSKGTQPQMIRSAQNASSLLSSNKLQFQQSSKSSNALSSSVSGGAPKRNSVHKMPVGNKKMNQLFNGSTQVITYNQIDPAGVGASGNQDSTLPNQETTEYASIKTSGQQASVLGRLAEARSVGTEKGQLGKSQALTKSQANASIKSQALAPTNHFRDRNDMMAMSLGADLQAAAIYINNPTVRKRGSSIRSASRKANQRSFESVKASQQATVRSTKQKQVSQTGLQVPATSRRYTALSKSPASSAISSKAPAKTKQPLWGRKPAKKELKFNPRQTIAYGGSVQQNESSNQESIYFDDSSQSQMAISQGGGAMEKKEEESSPIKQEGKKARASEERYASVEKIEEGSEGEVRASGTPNQTVENTKASAKVTAATPALIPPFTLSPPQPSTNLQHSNKEQPHTTIFHPIGPNPTIEEKTIPEPQTVVEATQVDAQAVEITQSQEQLMPVGGDRLSDSVQIVDEESGTALESVVALSKSRGSEALFEKTEERRQSVDVSRDKTMVVTKVVKRRYLSSLRSHEDDTEPPSQMEKLSFGSLRNLREASASKTRSLSQKKRLMYQKFLTTSASGGLVQAPQPSASLTLNRSSNIDVAAIQDSSNTLLSVSRPSESRPESQTDSLRPIQEPQSPTLPKDDQQAATDKMANPLALQQSVEILAVDSSHSAAQLDSQFSAQDDPQIDLYANPPVQQTPSPTSVQNFDTDPSDDQDYQAPNLSTDEQPHLYNQSQPSQSDLISDASPQILKAKPLHDSTEHKESALLKVEDGPTKLIDISSSVEARVLSQLQLLEAKPARNTDSDALLGASQVFQQDQGVQEGGAGAKQQEDLVGNEDMLLGGAMGAEEDDLFLLDSGSGLLNGDLVVGDGKADAALMSLLEDDGDNPLLHSSGESSLQTTPKASEAKTLALGENGAVGQAMHLTAPSQKSSGLLFMTPESRSSLDFAHSNAMLDSDGNEESKSASKDPAKTTSGPLAFNYVGCLSVISEEKSSVCLYDSVSAASNSALKQTLLFPPSSSGLHLNPTPTQFSKQGSKISLRRSAGVQSKGAEALLQVSPSRGVENSSLERYERKSAQNVIRNRYDGDCNPFGAQERPSRLSQQDIEEEKAEISVGGFAASEGGDASDLVIDNGQDGFEHSADEQEDELRVQSRPSRLSQPMETLEQIDSDEAAEQYQNEILSHRSSRDDPFLL